MFLSRNVRGGNYPTPAQIKNSASMGAGTRWKIQWVAVHDSSTCPFCDDMDGQRRAVNNPFYPGGEKFGDQHGGTKINCRCQEVLVRAS